MSHFCLRQEWEILLSARSQGPVTQPQGHKSCPSNQMRSEADFFPQLTLQMSVCDPLIAAM